MVTVACICPPKATGEIRHPDGDKVELRDKLDFKSGLAARNTVILLKQDDPDASTAEILAEMTEIFLLVGVRSWSVVDAKGKPVEVSRPAIREYLLSHQEAAMQVGDEAFNRYSEAVVAPLVQQAQNSLPTTPTNGSTSATSGPSHKRPRQPKPSLITTSPTDGTVTMSASPAGGSSSSPSAG